MPGKMKSQSIRTVKQGTFFGQQISMEIAGKMRIIILTYNTRHILYSVDK